MCPVTLHSFEDHYLFVSTYEAYWIRPAVYLAQLCISDSDNK